MGSIHYHIRPYIYGNRGLPPLALYKSPETLATQMSIVAIQINAIILFLTVQPCFLLLIKIDGVINSVIIFVFIGLYKLNIC